MSSPLSSVAAVTVEGDAKEQYRTISNTVAVASSHSWLPSSWRPTSSFLLAYTESVVLNRIADCQLTTSFVTLPCGAEIRTVRAVTTDPAACADGLAYLGRTPLLLLHGMGAAVGLWCRNIGPLCRQRPVYAIDILGFGRSSRVPFPLDSLDCEARFVDSIEQWRQAVGLSEGMMLLGHSFGGYLAFCYAIKYPGCVRHLLLADPWGLLEPPADYQPSPLFRRLAAAIEYWRLDPLDVLRAAGPFGPGLVRRFRGDLRGFFAEAAECGDDVLDYIYHCNAQVPSGETGFRRLTRLIAFARHPGLPRAGELPPDLPVTVIYGGRSRLYRLERARGEPNVGEKLRAARGGLGSGGVRVRELPECGHHIYVQDWLGFNRCVFEALGGDLGDDGAAA